MYVHLSGPVGRTRSTARAPSPTPPPNTRTHTPTPARPRTHARTSDEKAFSDAQSFSSDEPAGRASTSSSAAAPTSVMWQFEMPSLVSLEFAARLPASATQPSSPTELSLR